MPVAGVAGPVAAVAGDDTVVTLAGGPRDVAGRFAYARGCAVVG